MARVAKTAKTVRASEMARNAEMAKNAKVAKWVNGQIEKKWPEWPNVTSGQKNQKS